MSATVADPSRSTAGGRRRPAAAATAYPIFLRRTAWDKGAHRQLARPGWKPNGPYTFRGGNGRMRSEW
ncbi:hypothetical protein [Rhodococcus koreensis]|uniref:hypothetical protein n=1 Tax=Rhodococcus koreensis TaxID=99653 RepID=UPI001980DA01|nr:hypothetical protein [Rhodococcus koreensis]QSE84788.1 hypothetical protein JWS14_39695 [Rhodococcus koreensis]